MYLPGVGGEVDKSGGSPVHATQRQSVFWGWVGGVRDVSWSRRGGWYGGVGHSSRLAVGLDALTALHLWFVLSGLHLDVDYVVARWHVTLLALWHLLLWDDAVDFWQRKWIQLRSRRENLTNIFIHGHFFCSLESLKQERVSRLLAVAMDAAGRVFEEVFWWSQSRFLSKTK